MWPEDEDACDREPSNPKSHKMSGWSSGEALARLAFGGTFLDVHTAERRMNHLQLHPSRIPDLAKHRQRLRQKEIRKPDEFTIDDRKQLDEVTDNLLLALAGAVATLHTELAQTKTRARRGY